MSTPLRPEMKSGPKIVAARRVVRSFTTKEDAEHARRLLGEGEIEGEVHEYFMTNPTTGKRVARGCSLSVLQAQANEASRLLLKMAPSESPGGGARTGPSRLRRRPAPMPKQGGAGFMIAFAIFCVGGAALFAMSQLFGTKKRRAPVSDPNAPTLIYEEDINHDNVVDSVREFTMTNVPIAVSEDRDFDGIFEMRWIWQEGRLAYRDRDLDGNQKYDERTFYDAEGEPFYTNLQPNGKGFPQERRIFRERWVWKILLNENGGSGFTRVRELDAEGDVIRDEALPPNSLENAVPTFPLPALPEKKQEESPVKQVPATP
jgi:hypothetical protein